jgi:hypothetical protein
MAPAPPSLLAYFDASVHYGPDNATPTSAAVGVLVEDGTETYVERSLPVEAFRSSAALEHRALVEAVRAVTDRFDRPSSVHLRGDADAALRVTDPDHPAEPTDPVGRRRVRAVRERLADVPVVTYRAVDRARNRRAHDLARRGHDRG